jgi:glycerophosphoryl diester phosphodiesterase
MKNLTRWLLTLILATIVFSQGWGQTQTFKVIKSLNTSKAQGFKKTHGIKIETSGDWTVNLEVKTVKNAKFFVNVACNIFTTPERWDSPLRMYALDAKLSTQPDNDNFRHERYRVSDYFKAKLGSIICEESAFADTREFYSNQAYIAGEFINPSLNPFTKSRHVDVEITLTITGQLRLEDIEIVRIPGISDFTGLDFIKNQLPATHACADLSNTSQHCKTVRAIDSKQLSSKDIFVAAHRGLWGDQAETSIGAVLAAENSGWNVIEVDILKTKDNIPLLMHDQQINRLSEIGLDSNPTREYVRGSSEENPSNKTWLGQLNYSTTTTDVPTMSGGTRSLPPLRDLTLVNKWGERVQGTDDNLTKFRDAEELFNRLANWDIIIALDIKDKDQNDYLYVTEQLLRLGIKYGVLDKLMFKPGSGVAGLEYQLFADYLTGKTEIKDGVTIDLLDSFRNKVIVALILYANLFDTSTPQKDFETYMIPWLTMPSLSVVETQYKTGSDFFLVPNTKLGSITPVQWLKDLDFRTGTFWDNAIDCRGTSDGRGHWFAPDDNANNPGNYDFRGDLEWVINQSPGLIVTDRPDATIEYLNLFNLNSPLNKKP